MTVMYTAARRASQAVMNVIRPTSQQRPSNVDANEDSSSEW